MAASIFGAAASAWGYFFPSLDEDFPAFLTKFENAIAQDQTRAIEIAHEYLGTGNDPRDTQLTFRSRPFEVILHRLCTSGIATENILQIIHVMHKHGCKSQLSCLFEIGCLEEMEKNCEAQVKTLRSSYSNIDEVITIYIERCQGDESEENYLLDMTREFFELIQSTVNRHKYSDFLITFTEALSEDGVRALDFASDFFSIQIDQSLPEDVRTQEFAWIFLLLGLIDQERPAECIFAVFDALLETPAEHIPSYARITVIQLGYLIHIGDNLDTAWSAYSQEQLAAIKRYVDALITLLQKLQKDTHVEFFRNIQLAIERVHGSAQQPCTMVKV